MREIKYRGLDKNGVMHFGNLLQSKPYEDGRIDCYIQPKSILCLGSISTPTTSFVKVVEKTVGEFVGLKDMNGVDIYEGDQVEWVNGDTKKIDGATIEWDETYAGFGFDEHCLDWNHALNIVGNIHQNPELINE